MHRYIFSLMLLIMVLVSAANSQTVDQTYISQYNPLLNGATCTGATLTAAAASADSLDKTITLTATDRAKADCTWSITSSISIPTTRLVRVPKGVSVNIASGQTLTACIDAGDYQIFTGTGNLSIPLGCTTPLKAIWYGLTHTGLAKADANAQGSGLPMVLTSGTWVIGANTSLTGRYQVDRGATLSVSDTFTLSSAFAPDAGQYTIFSGAGVVRFTTAVTAKLNWWGADSTGIGTTTEVYFDRAIAALSTTYGGTLLGDGPQGIYSFGTSPANITKSNITVDMQGALLKSTLAGTRIKVNGDAGIAGDYSAEVQNFIFRNARIGAANDINNAMGLVSYKWCRNCLIENVFKQGQADTTLTFNTCTNCIARSVYIKGSDGSGSICAIIVMGDQSVFDNVVCDGTGEGWGGHVIQVKGGKGHRVVNSSVINVSNDDDPIYGIHARGYSPYEAAPTPEDSYPFATLGATNCVTDNCWALPDPRRQTQGAIFANLAVIDAPYTTAYHAQESTGVIFNNVYAYNVKQAASFVRVTGGDEKDFKLSNFYFENVGITANALSTVCINVAGKVNNHIRDVTVAQGTCREIAGTGLSLEYSNNSIVQSVNIVNAAQNIPVGSGLGNPFGFYAHTNNNSPKFISSTVRDVSASPTITRGFNITGTATFPTFLNNTVDCPSCSIADAGTTFRAFGSLAALGYYEGNIPSVGHYTTDDATPADDIIRPTVENGQVALLCVRVVAKQGTTNQAFYKSCGVFKAVGGTVALVGGSQFDEVTRESDPSWPGLITPFPLSGNAIIIRTTGVAATEITWDINVDIDLNN